MLVMALEIEKCLVKLSSKDEGKGSVWERQEARHTGRLALGVANSVSGDHSSPILSSVWNSHDQTLPFTTVALGNRWHMRFRGDKTSPNHHWVPGTEALLMQTGPSWLVAGKGWEELWWGQSPPQRLLAFPERLLIPLNLSVSYSELVFSFLKKT